MGGSFSKLWWAGGEVANHSRVCASHGLSPAGMGLRHDTQRFTSRNTNEMPMTKAPIVDTMFSACHPRLAGYDATRRGMPHRPRTYCGMNVTQNPMVSNQKWVLPIHSRYIRPKNFGYQK